MLRQTTEASAAVRFQIIGPLGAGGFGAVYEALDVRSGQRVALKELDNTSGDSIARFKHEFRAVSDCHHPNLVRLHELIEQDGRYSIVMELVPGCDLMEYIRGPQVSEDEPGRFDEGRLRSALTGVVDGLRALHDFGILHRDLKPSNVRVGPDGRAVLLDFGLATSVRAHEQSTHAMAVGTVRYMAPEQAGGKHLGPATDLYALGVCLFEALTGHTPFEGDSAVAILLAKQQAEAPRASSLKPDVPPDLDALCTRLLARDPAARPTAEETLHTLGGRPQENALRLPAPLQEEFAGRESELEHLERALAATHRGELRLVLVEGESGVGKSELVAEFLRRAAAGSARFTALRGRCYENEQVPYKAFDGCIDELAKHLRRMPEAECAALLPVRATLLGQLFPVLRTLRPIARAPREGVAADPTARRLEAFEALSSMLGTLAEEQALVLVIDDLQWADAESFRMLQALVARAFPPPLLLVATVRPRDELEPQVLDSITAVRAWKCTDVISLFGLPAQQAKTLAKTLLGPTAPDQLLEVIAEESGGHPLFLSELVQYMRSRDLSARGTLTLEAALRARIERLDGPARGLLEVAALAARPHAAHVFARALGRASIDEPARMLLGAKLLKMRKGQELGCYHDRIRHTVCALVGRARSLPLHRQLAAALAADPHADPVEQARQWDLAGESERAVAAYEVAIARAIETLTFTRAAELAARALELVDNSGDQRAQRLCEQRAHALACAGRLEESSALYLQAADRAHGDTRIRYRASAAAQLMLSGKTLVGFNMARKLLIELGVHLPLRPAVILLRFAWDRLLLALTPTTRAPGGATHRPLAGELLAQLSNAMGIVQPLSLLTLSMQHLRIARRTGSAIDAGLALAILGWVTTVIRSLAHALPLFERSRAALQHAPLSAIATATFSEGSARIAGADFVEAEACLLRAEELARVHRPESPWVITVIRYHLGVAWSFLGEHARVMRETDAWLAEARERNDVMAQALLSGLGYGFYRHLMIDAPQAALEERDRLLAALPPEPFTFAHLGLFISKTQTLLYQGGPSALRWLEGCEAMSKQTPFFKTRTGGDTFRAYLVQSLVHAAVAAPPDERAHLLRRARAAIGRLRSGSTLMMALAVLFDAQIAALDGQLERALDLARTARLRFEQLHIAIAQHALFLEGALEGGESRQRKQRAAVEAFRVQGWKRPLQGLLMNLAVPLALVGEDARRVPEDANRVGRYEIVASLGGGGQGSVVVARDVETGRRIALKELVQSSGRSLERFKREFRALQDLHHTNLVRVETLLEHDGRWYIVMELVEGSDLLTHLAAQPDRDASQVCRRIAGVAHGLAALHEAGFIHRDVTPSNVRVTSEGRVVLIDFALIAPRGDKLDAAGVGNPQYVAPEQLAGAPAAPSSDVYALGACLYEGLYGRPPRSGATSEHTPEPARGAVEKPIHELCLRMLAHDPAHRPTVDEVIAALAQAGGSEPLALPPQKFDEALRFTGREEELTALAEAFESTCDLGFMLAFVEGESGMGKSTLVSEFARERACSWPDLKVFASRCYESERVAFKAFDGAIDQLTALLRALPTPECEALLPKRAALLGLLFPVLSSVPAIAKATTKGLPADPSTQKRAALDCLLALLENLGARHELLFLVDDLQWADDESFALLHAMVEHRERLPFLCLCTIRPSAEIDAETARRIAELRALSSSRSVVLSGLSESAAREIALAIHGAPLAEERLLALVRESKGHPLFLRELIGHEKRSPADAPMALLKLDAAVRAHIASLREDARRLLTMVALAGRPIGAHHHARALGYGELPREALITLFAHGLLQQRGDNELVCYHDRIRQVAVDLLDPSERQRAAEALAAALDTAQAGEPAERARLWDEAGSAARASKAYEEAGDRALAGLGFAQAAQHYARALELLTPLGDGGDARASRLLELRGHALVRDGRSAEAARVYQQAAARAEGEAKVRLRIWAAQHLIQSAQVAEGMRAASELLGELGLSLPTTERGAVARIALERARIKLRGTTIRPVRRPSSERERMQLEALYGLSSPVRAIAYLPGSMLVAQYLRRALKAGAPVHTARGLAFEGLFRSLNAPDKDQSLLFDRSRALAERTGDPTLLAEIELVRGITYNTRNDFARAQVHLSQAHELLQTECPGERWLLTATRMSLGSAWYYNGDLGPIARHTGAWMDEARARDDRYAVAAISGFGWASMRHVIAGRPDAAIAELEAALAPWPDDPFTTNHFGAFAAMGMAMCAERPADALAWVDRDAPRRRRSYLMRTPTGRLVESTAVLCALMHRLARVDGAERAQLIVRGGREAKRMRQNPSKAAPGVALTFEGMLQLARGQRSMARASFGAGAEQLSNVGNPFLGARARYLEGVLEGDETGQSKAAPFLQQVHSQGWTTIDHGLDFWLPARSLLKE